MHTHRPYRSREDILASRPLPSPVLSRERAYWQACSCGAARKVKRLSENIEYGDWLDAPPMLG